MPLPSPRNTNMNINTTSPRGEPTAESTTSSASLPAATTTTSAAAAASSSASSSTSTTTTTTTMMHIASTLCREGREAWQRHDTVLALQKFGIAARVLETALGSFHPLVAKTYYWIGFIYKHSLTMRRSSSSSAITDNGAVVNSNKIQTNEKKEEENDSETHSTAITNSQIDLDYLLLALAAFTKSARIRFSLPEKKKKNHDSNSTTATTSTTTITKNPIQETKQAIQWVVRAIQDKCETRTKQDISEILHHHDFHFKSWWQLLQTFQAIILTTNSGQNSGSSNRNISSFDGTYYLDRLQHSIQLEAQGDALLRSYQYETALESYEGALSEFPDPHHASLWAKCAFVHCQLHIQRQKQPHTDNNNSHTYDHHHFLMKSIFQYRQALKILYASHAMVLQVRVKQPQDDTSIMERPSSNNNDNADSSAFKSPILLPLEDHPDTKTTLERLVQVIQEVDENSSTMKQQDPPHPINNTTPQLLSASSSSSLLLLYKAMMQSVRMEHWADEYLWNFAWATRMRIVSGRVTNHKSTPSPNLHHFQWLLPKAQQRYHQALNAMLAATCSEGDGGGGRGGSSGQLSSSSFPRWKDPTIQWLKQCIEETNLIQEPILTDDKASSLSSSHSSSNGVTLHRSSNSGRITTTTNTTTNSRSNNNNTGINRMIRTLASKIIQSPSTPKASSSTTTIKKTTTAEAPTNSKTLDLLHTSVPIYGPAMDSHDLKQQQRQKPSQSLQPEGIKPPPFPLSDPMTSNKPTISQSNANPESDRPWKASAATTGTGASCSLLEQPPDVVKLKSQVVMLLEQSKELRNTISKQSQTIEELRGHFKQQAFKEEDNNNIQQSSLQPQCIGDSQDPSNDRNSTTTATCLVQELQSMNDELRRTLATTSKQLVAVQLGKEQVSQSLSQVQSKFNKSELQLQKAESELSLLQSRLRTSRERAEELSDKRRARMSSSSSGSGSLQTPSQSNEKKLKHSSSHQSQALNDLKECNIHKRQWDRMEPRNVTVPQVHAVPQTPPVQRQLEQTSNIGDQELFSQSTSSKPKEKQSKDRTDKYTQTVQSPAPPLLQQSNNNDDLDWKSELADASLVRQQEGTATKLDRLEQELFKTHQKYQQILWKSRRLETELALFQPKVPQLLPRSSSSSSLPLSTKEDHFDMNWVAHNIEITFEKASFLRETLKQTKLGMESVRQSLMVSIMAEQEEVELGTDHEQQQQLKMLLEEAMIKLISMIATIDSSCSLADTLVQDKENWFAQINTLVHTKPRIENIAKKETHEAAVQTFQEGLESLRNNDQSRQFTKKGPEKEENMESFSNDVPIFAAKLDTFVKQKEEIVQWEDNLLLQEKCKEYDNKHLAAVAKLDAATAELLSLRNTKASLKLELECIKKEHSSILLSELLQQNPNKEDAKDEEKQTNNHSLLVAKEVAAQVPSNLQKHKDDLAEKDRMILQLQQEKESLTNRKNKMPHTHIMNSSNNSGQASAVESHQQDTIHPAPPDATIHNELEFLRSQLTELKAKQSTEVVSKATALVSHFESYQKDVAKTLNELSKEIAALAQPPPPEQPTNVQSVGEQNCTESPSSRQLPPTGFMMGRHKEELERIQTSIKFLQRDRSKQVAAITRLRLQNNQAADLISTMTSQLKSRNHKYKILRQRTTKLICVFDSLEQHIRTLRRSCQSLGVAIVTPIQQSLIELGHDLHAIHVLSKGLKAVNKAQPPVSATVSTSQSLSSLSLLTNDMNATVGETYVSLLGDYGVAAAPAIMNEQPLVIAQDPLLTMAASYISTRIETDLAVYEIRNICRSSVQDDRRDESWLINMFGSSHPPNHMDMPTPWYQYWSNIRFKTASSHLEVVARIKVDDNQCLLYVQVMRDGKSCRIWTRNRSATMGDKENVEWTDHGNPNVRDRPLGWVAIDTKGNNQIYFSFDEVLEEAWLIREQYGRKLYHCYTQLSSLRSSLQSWRWLRQYYIDHKDIVVAACLVMTALQNVTWWWRE